MPNVERKLDIGTVPPKEKGVQCLYTPYIKGAVGIQGRLPQVLFIYSITYSVQIIMRTSTIRLIETIPIENF